MPAQRPGKRSSALWKKTVYTGRRELGAVDQGGGGTIAKLVAQLNIDTVDLGVPIISMHAPFELSSKLDVYNTYKASVLFINKQTGNEKNMKL